MRRKTWVSEHPETDVPDGTITEEGFTVVEVSRGIESQSSGTNKSGPGEAVVEVSRGSGSPSPDSDVVIDDEPAPPKFEWASSGAIRQEMLKQKRGDK